MATNVIDDILQDMQKFFGRNLSQVQEAFYRAEMLDMDETDLCSAILSVKRNEPPGMLPTLAVIRKHYSQALEQRLARDKEKAPIFADVERNANKSKHGMEAVKLMVSLYTGGANRERYLVDMRAMDEKYPGMGWGKAAKELEAFWKSEGQRHLKSRAYLTKVWSLQDANGFRTINNPPWYKPEARKESKEPSPDRKSLIDAPPF